MTENASVPRSGTHTAGGAPRAIHPAGRATGNSTTDILKYYEAIAQTDLTEAKALHERAFDIATGIRKSKSLASKPGWSKFRQAAFARRQLKILLRAVAANEAAAAAMRAAVKDWGKELATDDDTRKIRAGGINFDK